MAARPARAPPWQPGKARSSGRPGGARRRAAPLSLSGPARERRWCAAARGGGAVCHSKLYVRVARARSGRAAGANGQAPTGRRGGSCLWRQRVSQPGTARQKGCSGRRWGGVRERARAAPARRAESIYRRPGILDVAAHAAWRPRWRLEQTMARARPRGACHGHFDSTMTSCCIVEFRRLQTGTIFLQVNYSTPPKSRRKNRDPNDDSPFWSSWVTAHLGLTGSLATLIALKSAHPARRS